jgi:hypothetical protein
MWMTATVVLLTGLSVTPIKVAATRVNLVDGTEARAQFYTEHLVDRLSEQGLQVTSPREVAAILGVERQRELLGCAEQNGCLAEIANALGVDGLVLGDLARVGRSFQVNVKIIAAQSGRRLATFSASVDAEGELVSTLTRAAAELARDLRLSLGGQAPTRQAGGARRWWWVPSIVAVGGLVLASVEFASAENARVTLLNGFFDSSAALQRLQAGQGARTVGFISAGVATAALLTMTGLLVFGGEPQLAPSAWLGPSGAGLGVSGVLP